MTKKPTRTESLVAEDVQAALMALERMSTKRDRDNLVRFGINAKKALRRVDGEPPGAGQAARRSHEPAAASGIPAGTRLAD